ncbi:hypothetical protein FB45DRAFT_949587 [Roridomyces roridus]|uniref:Uncharacterized protein n=1 Tax=Roridomyces roridus TaxID=1738132 RepID=A0AAD7B0Z9_9AGAR|nr:hypothetical protein FB45DRAFT_949587 [Roridomyces roridus]
MADWSERDMAVDRAHAQRCCRWRSRKGNNKTTFENGINMFDTAEDDAKGKSELQMGRSSDPQDYRRSFEQD